MWHDKWPRDEIGRRGKTINYVSGGWVNQERVLQEKLGLKQKQNNNNKKNSLNDLFVYKTGTHELGMVQPNEENSLDNVVEWNPTRNEACDRFSDRKACENNPISQPLRVIGSITRVDSLKRHVSGVDECKNIGEEFCSTNGHDDRGDNRSKGEEDVGFGLSSLLFKITESVCTYGLFI